MDTIEENLDQVRSLIQDPNFLQGIGLSNEINIRIFCYDPSQEMAVRNFIETISMDQSLKCNLKIYDLYQIFLESCEELGILDDISEMEESDGRDFLLEQLHSAIGADVFAEKIQYEPQKEGDVIVLTGVGAAFPFIRLHLLLEVLQPVFPHTPILVMYPGEFDNHRLKLFNILKPNDYYRAFNVIETKGEVQK